MGLGRFGVPVVEGVWVLLCFYVPGLGGGVDLCGGKWGQVVRTFFFVFVEL